MKKEMMNRLQNGDVTAMEEVYDEYANALYNYGMSISAMKENAEDAVADTFIKLYKYVASGRHIIKAGNRRRIFVSLFFN